MASTRGSGSTSRGFSAEERAAMKEHAKELKDAERRAKQADKADAEEKDVLDAITGLPDADRTLAEQVHTIVRSGAPGLLPRLWYGMPAYAKDGKVVCFFQPASKFKARYSTLGFNDVAALDDGAMWATAFALTKLGPAEKKRIRALVEQAAG